jgi:hypothetical protein
VSRPTRSYVDEITSGADQWLRRCNGKPKAGIPVSQHGLRIVLGSSRDVTVDACGVISWTGAAGKFTAEPVRNDVDC